MLMKMAIQMQVTLSPLTVHNGKTETEMDGETILTGIILIFSLTIQANGLTRMEMVTATGLFLPTATSSLTILPSGVILMATDLETTQKETTAINVQNCSDNLQFLPLEAALTQIMTGL